MADLIDLTGRKIARWTVLYQKGKRGPHVAWMCRCDCGTEKQVNGANLRRGATTGCGCERGKSNLSHGHSQKKTGRTWTYNAWRSMKTRTLNPNFTDRARYADRGIKCSERWLSFENFLEDMGECPTDHSLDRIDNDRGYETGNCRWANRATQNRNTSRNRWVALLGERMVLKDAARRMGVTEAAIYNQMKRKSLELQDVIDRMAARRL